MKKLLCALLVMWLAAAAPATIHYFFRVTAEGELVNSMTIDDAVDPAWQTTFRWVATIDGVERYELKVTEAEYSAGYSSVSTTRVAELIGYARGAAAGDQAYALQADLLALEAEYDAHAADSAARLQFLSSRNPWIYVGTQTWDFTTTNGIDDWEYRTGSAWSNAYASRSFSDYGAIVYGSPWYWPWVGAVSNYPSLRWRGSQTAAVYRVTWYMRKPSTDATFPCSLVFGPTTGEVSGAITSYVEGAESTVIFATNGVPIEFIRGNFYTALQILTVKVEWASTLSDAAQIVHQPLEPASNTITLGSAEHPFAGIHSQAGALTGVAWTNMLCDGSYTGGTMTVQWDGTNFTLGP